MKELMVALMLWISTQTGYNANVGPPHVVFASPGEVASICADGALVPYLAQACYKLHEHTVYLRDDFQVENRATVGVLVHELTHVLQFSNGREYNYSTMDYLENEADFVESIYESSPRVQAYIRQAFSQGYAAASPQVQTAAPVAVARPRAMEIEPAPVESSPPSCCTPGGELIPETVARPAKANQPQRSPAVLTKPTPVERPSPVETERLSGYGVHFESYTTKGEADLAAAELKKRLGRGCRVARVDLKNKGIYFRVYTGPFSNRSAAVSLARKLKSKVDYAAVIALD